MGDLRSRPITKTGRRVFAKSVAPDKKDGCLVTSSERTKGSVAPLRSAQKLISRKDHKCMCQWMKESIFRCIQTLNGDVTIIMCYTEKQSVLKGDFHLVVMDKSHMVWTLFWKYNPNPAHLTLACFISPSRIKGNWFWSCCYLKHVCSIRMHFLLCHVKIGQNWLFVWLKLLKQEKSIV